MNRGQLDFALGTMSIDENGAWIDPGPIGPKHGYPALSEEETQDETDDTDRPSDETPEESKDTEA